MIPVKITLRGHTFTFRADTDDPAEAKRRAAEFAKKVEPLMDSRGMLTTPLEWCDVRTTQ